MALSDITVFNEWLRSSTTEIVTQEVEKFNAASRGTITLSAAAIPGDFKDEVRWELISGLVRRRNPYGTGSVSSVTLGDLVDTIVKVASGTPPLEFTLAQFDWIKRNPEEAGMVYGRQLAEAMMQDMLNTAILGGYAAMVQNAAMLYDATSDTPETLTPSAMVKARQKMGDRGQDIAAWVTHSLPYYNLITNNLTNTNNLFVFGTVAISTDALGTPIIVSDSPSLINTTPTPDTYHVLGLVPGAINVTQNDDFVTNTETKNGNENIIRTIQSEWSYNLGVKGYAWDKTNGGKAPTNSAIGTSTNWDKTVTSDKDGPGVVLRVDFA